MSDAQTGQNSEKARGRLFDIALFPIPELVVFPGANVPLHVFEPRYRKLVHDAIDAERLIGVCHTVKQISRGRDSQTLDEALASNQATYQPQEVFSAGFAEIMDVTDDGRIHLVVRIVGRFRIVEEIQTLPYRIDRCVPLEDTIEDDEVAAANASVQQQINGEILKLVANQDPALAARIDWASLRELDPAEYSYRIFDFLRFDADIMQNILQSESSHERLTMIRRILQHATGI